MEAQVLQDIMSSGTGDLLNPAGSGVEQFFYNLADPNKEVNGEKSSPTTRHPFLTDSKVREAMALPVDRQTMVKQLYGDGLTLFTSPDSGFPVQYMGRFYTGKDQDRNRAQKANNRPAAAS